MRERLHQAHNLAVTLYVLHLACNDKGFVVLCRTKITPYKYGIIVRYWDLDLMDNISEYRDIIERFARDRVDARVPNGLPLHASILIETMFKSATAEMRIFTRELDTAVFGRDDIMAAVEKFIGRPYATLKILLQKPQDEKWAVDHPLVAKLNAFSQSSSHGSFVIRNAVGSYANNDANHFAVMDNDGFRYELDHDHCKAMANFNEPKTAKKLVEVFEQAFDISAQERSEPLYEIKPATV